MEIYQSISFSIIFLSYLIIILSYLISGTKEYRNLLRKVKDIIINHKYRDLILILIITMIFLSPLLGYYYIFYLNIPLNMLLILAYIYSIFCLYLFLYQLKRLDMSFVSFISFLFNLLFLSLFIFGFYNLAYGLDKPIYLEDLSLFSFYRYLILVILSFCALFLYISSKYVYPQLIISFQWITFPYLKHHMFILLDGLYLNLFSSFIIDILASSKKYLLLIIDIFLLYIVNSLHILLFFNFIVNGGDLRWNIYLLPFSFISFIYSYAKYFFNQFFEGHCNYVRMVLHVTLKGQLKPEEIGKEILCRPREDLYFTITPYGYSQGYTYIGLFSLINSWSKAANISCFLESYNKKFYYFSSLILILRITSWVMLTYTFLAGHGPGDLFRGSIRFFHSTPPLREPIRAFSLQRDFHKDLEKLSKGVYKPGHLVATDTDKAEEGLCKLETQPTHGPGSSSNPSKFLYSKDLMGNPREQRGTFTIDPLFFRMSWLGLPIEGSEDFFQLPQVLENLREAQRSHFSFLLVGMPYDPDRRFLLIGKPYIPSNASNALVMYKKREIVVYAQSKVHDFPPTPPTMTSEHSVIANNSNPAFSNAQDHSFWSEVD